jgi:hypothetical protein
MTSGTLDVVRPFAWLAVIAFLVGFVSYLALGHPTPAQADDSARAAAASGPSSDEWNLPKHI